MDFQKANSRMLRHVTLPSHQGTISNPSGRAIGIGSCGDSLEVTLRVQGERIVEIRHPPNGCAFTIACGSAMSELARGRPLDRALEITPQDIERELGGASAGPLALYAPGGQHPGGGDRRMLPATRRVVSCADPCDRRGEQPRCRYSTFIAIDAATAGRPWSCRRIPCWHARRAAGLTRKN